MELSLNSTEKLDSFLAELEPTLPAPVCIRRLRLDDSDFFKHAPRYLFSRSNVKATPPNPVGIHLRLHSGYAPFVVAVELYVKVGGKYDEDSAWLYSVNFVVDEFLSREEVQKKVLQAAHIVVGYRDRKFECGDFPVDAAGRSLSDDEGIGEVMVCVEESDLEIGT